MAREPFADLWEQWYRGTNEVVKRDDTPLVLGDILRTQFQLLDAVVARHMSCAEELCGDKQAIRRILEATP